MGGEAKSSGAGARRDLGLYRLDSGDDYGGPVAPSILRKTSPEDAVIVFQSFSKSYRMVRKATQLKEFIVSHAASMTQKAAEAALAQGEAGIAAMVARLRENRDFARAALDEMPGVTVPEPEGAFYLFPEIAGLADSFDFCRRLLVEKKVGLAPGVVFGEGGEGSVRICYGADRSVLEPALERLDGFLRGR